MRSADGQIDVGGNLGSLLQLRFGVDRFGEYFANDANTVVVPSYTILSVTAQLQRPIRSVNGWGLNGFVTVQNLTDKDYIGSSFMNPDFVGGAAAAYEPGFAPYGTRFAFVRPHVNQGVRV